VRRIAIPLFLALPAAAAAVSHPPRPPAPMPAVMNQDPHYSCQAERRGADGSVSISRHLSSAGAAGPSHAMWTKEFGAGGVLLSSTWDPPAPRESSRIHLFYQNSDSRRAYRFRVQRSAPNGGNRLLFDSGLLRRPDGFLQISTEWRRLSRRLAGAADSRLLIVRSDDMVIRSDPIDPEILSRVVATAASLQPELDAMVADYRHRCRFVPPPGVVY
jgi:hypothetical protein